MSTKKAGPEEHDMSRPCANQLRESLAPSKRTVGRRRWHDKLSTMRFASSEKMGQPGDQKLTQITSDEELR
jgi:hypothetical protein